jgi:hypothetical protein
LAPNSQFEQAGRSRSKGLFLLLLLFLPIILASSPSVALARTQGSDAAQQPTDVPSLLGKFDAGAWSGNNYVYDWFPLVPNVGGQLIRVAAEKFLCANGACSQAYYAVCAVDGGRYNGCPAGSLLATSDPAHSYPVGGGNLAEVQFTFSGANAITLSAGTTYYVRPYIGPLSGCSFGSNYCGGSGQALAGALQTFHGNAAAAPSEPCGTAEQVRDELVVRRSGLNELNSHARANYLPTQGGARTAIFRLMSSIQGYDDIYFKARAAFDSAGYEYSIGLAETARGDIASACRARDRGDRKRDAMQLLDQAATESWAATGVNLTARIRLFLDTLQGLFNGGCKVIKLAGIVLPLAKIKSLPCRAVIVASVPAEAALDAYIAGQGLDLAAVRSDVLWTITEELTSEQLGASFHQATSPQVIHLLAKRVANGELRHQLAAKLVRFLPGASDSAAEFIVARARQAIEDLGGDPGCPVLVPPSADGASLDVSNALSTISIAGGCGPVSVGPGVVALTDETRGISVPVESVRARGSGVDVTPSLTLTQGHVYKLTVPPGIATEGGRGNASIEWRFTTQPIQMAVGRTAVVSNTGGHGLNLRSTPAFLADGTNTIAVLSEGVRATVTGGPVSADGFTWWRVAAGGNSGWSAVGDWLRPIESGGLQAGAKATVTNTGGIGLRLRMGAGLASPIITTQAEGTAATLIGGPYPTDGHLWWHLEGPMGPGFSATAAWLLPTESTGLPGAVTGATSAITSRTALVTGTVTPNASNTLVYFEYWRSALSTIQATVRIPVAGDGDASVAVSAPLSDLAEDTTYSYRVVAMNDAGSGIGAVGSFRTAVAVPVVSLTTDRNSIPFGTVAVGQPSAAPGFVITNPSSSTGALVGNVEGLAAPFQVVAGEGSFTLQPGQSRIVAVGYTPAAETSSSADLVITSNAPSSPTRIAVSGTGQAIALGIEINPNPVVWENVRVNDSIRADLVITNPASSTANLNLTIDSPSGPFGRDNCASLALGIGTSFTCTLRFTPTSQGEFRATLTLHHNAAGNISTVSLIGRTIRSRLVVSPSSIDFGDVRVGDARRQTITITNDASATGNVRGNVQNGGPGSEISLESGSIAFDLAPGQSATNGIKFAPTLSGTFSGSFIVTHDAPGSPTTVSITGRNDASSPTLFTDIGGPFTAVSAGSVTWGDYDNDGDLDAFVMGYATNSGTRITKLFRNNGVAGFQDVAATFPSLNGGAAAWADCDNDGDLDLALAGYDGSTFRLGVYRNGGGAFTSVPNGALVAVGAPALAWGDVDGDGRQDLLVTGSPDGSAALARLYRNDGGCAFSDSGAVVPGVSNGSLAWGDYDSDGDPDLLISGSAGGTPVVRLHRNDGGGHFTEIFLPLPAIDSAAVAWGDYDNDGQIDIAIAGRLNSEGVVRVYRNTGSGVFVDSGARLPGTGRTGSILWGDYDNDGDRDLLVTGETVTKVYRSDGGGFFTDIGAWLPPGVGGAGWGDFDNNGTLDLLAAGNSASLARIYKNNTTYTNTTPLAPANLGASVQGPTATLTWDKATDPETPLDGLTYDVRVGTTPGGGQVVSSASSSSGVRRIPQAGNAGHRNDLSIGGLANGTYYWSVQSIDTSLAGSAFAAEKTFSVGPAPTSTSLISSLNPSMLGQSVTLTASVTSLGGTPTGAVTFKDAGAALGTATLLSGSATLSTTSLVVGSHSITAVYVGDGLFLGGTSSPLDQIVNTLPATAPGVPTIGTATAGNTTVSVAFSPPGSNGGSAITSYTVTCGARSMSGSTSPITVTGLANGVAVTCTVLATNAVGNSSASAASNSVTPATVPSAPTIGVVTAGSGTVSVTFSAPASDGGAAITGYSATCGATLASGPASPISLTGLTNGTAVTCTVFATNAVGNSGPSASSNSVTPASVPSITSPTSAGVTGTTATLGGTVTSDGGAAITERGVVFSLTSVNANPLIGGSNVSKLMVPGTTGAFTSVATSFLPTSGYSFRAFATNSIGTSYTEVATFSTLAATLPVLSINDVSTIEGNTGLKAYDFAVSLSAASSGTVLVSYTIQSGTAASGEDYTAASGLLTFAPGQTAKTIQVLVFGDTAKESDETFSVVLSSPSNATITKATGVGVILDDDGGTNSPGVSINDASVTEGHSGPSLLSFSIELTKASANSITINYATSNGTATAGVDYMAGSGSFSIPAGTTTKKLTIPIQGDQVAEPEETVLVTISTTEALAIILKPVATGTIVNDDPPQAATPILQYRLYHDGTKEHLYTTDLNEYNVLGSRGWTQEGVAYRMLTNGVYNGVSATIPLFRAYHPGILQHLWTTDSNEAATLGGTSSWFYEDIIGYMLPTQAAGTIPLYRLALASPPIHLWTTDLNEYTVLQTRGWTGEGIIGYVVP